MAELEVCFERQGFGNVSTYIQSGNVLFEAGAGRRAALTRESERALSETFGYSAKTCCAVSVIFLKEPLTAALAMNHDEDLALMGATD